VKGCKAFHDGLYAYDDKSFEGVKVMRLPKQNSQIEVLGDSIHTYFMIEWTSDCHYNLVPQKVVYKNQIKNLPKDTIRVDIIEIISKEVYRYQAIVHNDTTHGIMRKLSSVKTK
jgi:hypothetical protein